MRRSGRTTRSPTLSCCDAPYDFSAVEHKGQVRRSGEPYLSHPLEVADLMADMKLDVVAISAGLLHDVVEDTLTSIQRIRELFGAEVAQLVEGVTKLNALPVASTEERQAENFPQDAAGDGR